MDLGMDSECSPQEGATYHAWRRSHTPGVSHDCAPRRVTCCPAGLAREMVKATANKAIEPAKEFFTETGEMMILTGRTVLSAIKPPYPTATSSSASSSSPFSFAGSLMLISCVAFGFGARGSQAANFPFALRSSRPPRRFLLFWPRFASSHRS